MTREQFIDQVKMIAKEEGFTVMGAVSDLPQTNLIRITLSDGAGYFDITVDMDGNNDLTFNTLRHALQIKGGSTTRYWVLDLHIRKVIFNYPATIVLWADGTKTVVKAGDRDVYDPEKGLAMAIAKKALGNQGDYYEVFKDWLPKEEESSISLTGLFKKLDKLTEKLSKITMTKKGE